MPGPYEPLTEDLLIYNRDKAEGYYRTHIPPMDHSTPEAWAASMIAKMRAANKYGFGMIWGQTEPYDVENFRWDIAGGDIPGEQKKSNACLWAYMAHPEMDAVEEEFREKHGAGYMWKGMDPREYME